MRGTAVIRESLLIACAVVFVLAWAAPVALAIDLPIGIDTQSTLGQQYGYTPLHPLNIPSFDLANRPLFRSRTESQHVTRWAVQVGPDGWISTPLLTAVKKAYPRFTGTVNAGGYVSERIEVDDCGRAYTLLQIRVRGGNLYNVLLYSLDGCRTWRLVTLPFGGKRVAYDGRDNGTAALEQYAGWNHSPRPPLVAVWRPVSDWPGARASRNRLYVLKPYFRGGRLRLPDPTLVSTRYIGQTYGAGGASFAASTATTSYVVWPEISRRGDSGTPTRVCTFDHATRTISERRLLAQARPRNDDHDAPGIVRDGAGYLHVLTGAHNAPFLYTHSVNPLDATSWTIPEQVLQGGHVSADGQKPGSARQTYLSLACLPDGSLVTAFRQSRRGVDADFDGAQYDALCAQRRSPDGIWSDAQRLVFRLDGPGYANYHQKLTVDRLGRLYLSLSHFSPVTVSGDERQDYRFTHRMVLVSADGGVTWDFSSPEGFVAGIIPSGP